MRAWSPFACLVVLLSWVATATAGNVIVGAGAKVTSVDLAKQRATIDRGSRAGIHVGDYGGIYPMRANKEAALDERSARGKVIEVKDTTAVLALEAVADNVEVGSYFSNEISVPEELAKSPLFTVVALGVDLRVMDDVKLWITTEEMLANPSAALRDKVLNGVIAEIKENRDIIESVVTGRISNGRHHGKQAAKVIDELTPAELLDFLVFVESFPGKYINHRWKFAEIYFTWIISGTPTGDRERKVRLLDPAIEAARSAQAKGRLDDARAKWQAILLDVPDHEEAKTEVARIDKMQLWMRQLATDPDNTSVRDKLSFGYFQTGAFALAIAELDKLIKAKFEVFESTRLRAKSFALMRKWREADDALNRLLKEKPNDRDIVHWLNYVKVKQRLDRTPDDPAARLALAKVYFDEGADGRNNALREYRRVLDGKNVTKAQIDQVKDAQRRIAVDRDLETRVSNAKTAIETHDIARARADIEQALKLVDELGEPARAPAILNRLANAAGTAAEADLKLELLDRRAKLTTDDNASDALGFALLNADRYDDAVAAAKRSANQNIFVLAHIALARGDLAEAEKLAINFSKARRKAEWPKLILAAIEASRGNWQDAVDYARKAYEIDDPSYQWDLRRTLNAALRGQRAQDALKAKPSSARDRLRMVRALAELGLVRAASAEIAKLPADGSWRSDGWWSIAGSSYGHVALVERVAAARNGKAVTPARKRGLARFQAELKLRDQPNDEANRILLAKLYIQDGSYHYALATLNAVMQVKPIKPAVADLVRDARDSLAARDALSLASDARDRGDFVGAMKLATEFQNLADRTGEVLGQLSARESRIHILADQGRYVEAINVAEEGLALMTADGDPMLTSMGAGHLARLQAQVGTNEPHRKVVVDNVKLCDDLDQEFCLYYAYDELASLSAEDGQYADAIEYMRKAWTSAEAQADHDKVRESRRQLARLNFSVGRAADAEQLAVGVLADARKAASIDDEQDMLLLLGSIASFRGQGKVARGRFQEVYELGTRTGHTWRRSVARRAEGWAYLGVDKDFAKAATSFEQGAALLEGLSDSASIRARTSAMRGLARARLKEGNLAAARQGAEQALAIAQKYQRRATLVVTHVLLAEVALAEANAAAALTSAKAALDLAKLTDDSDALTDAWYVQAQALALNKQDNDAVDAYEKALAFLGKSIFTIGNDADRESNLKVGDTRDLYRNAVEQLLKVGKSDRAMEVLELARDMDLQGAFDVTTVKPSDPKVRAKLEEYEQARARMQALEKQLEAAVNKSATQRSETQVRALGEQIAKTTSALNGVVVDLKATHRQLSRALASDSETLFKRRADLPAGSVLVQYFAADDALYAFVIERASKKPALVRVKVTHTELAKTVADYRAAILQEAEKVKARGEVERLGRQLDDWLLEPLRPHLTNAMTVLIVPFGALFYVPFDALVVSPKGKPIRYAIEDFRVSIQTSTTLESVMKAARPRGTGTLLAISNPDGTLPGAQREVSRIEKVFPGLRVLGRKDGTIETFKSIVGNYRYVHMATHGVLETDSRKSYLKMAANGQLTVQDIAMLKGLDQANELVVLSACESAVDLSSAAGDDMITMAGGFSAAGAPSLVASLWEVDDDATADLMSAFYRTLENSGSDRLESLRTAKLGLLRAKQGATSRFGQPWYWASFQLYGDFR